MFLQCERLYYYTRLGTAGDFGESCSRAGCIAAILELWQCKVRNLDQSILRCANERAPTYRLVVVYGDVAYPRLNEPNATVQFRS